ncbi:MAG: glucosaminidase domain-containing protein [Candidatus Absconditabacterales bacterium]
MVNQSPPNEPVADIENLKLSLATRPEDKAFTQEQHDSLQRAYIEKYRSVAQAMMRQYGVPASVLLAQGLHESQAGTSKLARENYNHFAVQCFGEKCGSGHCSNPYSHIHKTFFRIYHNPWESWEAQAQRISRGWPYRKYLPHDGLRYAAYAWTRALQDNNFSSDRQYGEKLYNLIKKYDLEELDE